MFKVCVLASGSSANCIYVASSRTRILVDAGLSGRETARRLAQAGADLPDVRAVCLTHEHDDHRSSLRLLHRRYGLAVYANRGTIEAMERGGAFDEVTWNMFTTGVAFQVGDLIVEPFSVPHDSYEPVGFIISAGDRRLGIVTDMGMPTDLIRERLRSCTAVIVEANHDEDMLREADRPWPLKQRIAGRQGHLSNSQAGELLADVAGPELRSAFLAHLSSHCNRPELALHTVRRALEARGQNHVQVKLTYPDRASEVVEV